MIEWFDRNNYIKKDIDVDNNYYEVYLKETVFSPETSPRIVVVSYQPNEKSSELLKLCIESIKKFTVSDYELWIVDNNSPFANIKWIDNVKDINIAYIRTEPKGGASYANGLALEIAARLINPDTEYLVCFHEDIAVCRYGWLKYMLSRMDGKIKASGFRLTRARVPEGVLHVCGYMIDFQLLKKLELSFLPELPKFDVGDKAIYLLKENGFDIFSTPNTFDDPELVKLIPRTMEAFYLNVTRSFNERNEIIYMHLGRGIPKARGEYKNRDKSSSEQWSSYIRSNLLSEPSTQLIEPERADYFDFSVNSIRYFYVVNFIMDNLNLLSDESNVFCYGKEDKNLVKKRLSISYLTELPAGNKKFDCAIFPEIKNTDDKRNIVEWSWDNLKAGGILLMTAPSLSNPERNQMYDFKNSSNPIIYKLWGAGFREVSVKVQGSDESVLLQSELERLKIKTEDLDKEKARAVINRYIIKRLKRLLNTDNKLEKNKTPKSVNITTGYGIKAVK